MISQPYQSVLKPESFKHIKDRYMLVYFPEGNEYLERMYFTKRSSALGKARVIGKKKTNHNIRVHKLVLKVGD